MELENEEHCLITCNRYADIRNTLFAAAINVENVFFIFFYFYRNRWEKLSFILSSVKLVFETAKACQQVLHNRTQFFYTDKEGIYFVLYSNIIDDFNLSY